MSSVKCVLTAKVVYVKAGPVKKPTVATVAVLSFGPLTMGSAKLYGTWTPEQVISDFKLKKGKALLDVVTR